ncbi:MAG: AraC family transcriptional regulator [Desulfovibrio sp.]|nr:MAG: AraC family transcriptional regulator [Desulfovibrio sp.]
MEQFFTRFPRAPSLDMSKDTAMHPTHTVTYAHDQDLPGLESCYVHQSEHAFPDHFHDSTFVVGAMVHGRCYTLGLGREEGEVVPGDLAMINPGQVHSGVPVPGQHRSYNIVTLSMELMEHLVHELGEDTPVRPEFTRVIQHDPKGSELFRHLSYLVLSGKGSRLHKESVALAAMARVLDQNKARVGSGLSERSSTEMQRAREFLSQDLAAKISLKEAAEVAGLSSYHFLRKFKAGFGLSPHQFRTQQRVERARSLLKAGLPIARVAQDMGFTDQAHFTHAFRKFTGVTPKRFVAA